MKKGSHFQWSESHSIDFEKLKKKLTTISVLTVFDCSKPFEVYCDFSFEGSSCVLMQEGKAIAYASHRGS